MHWPKIHVELQMEDPWLGGLGYVATFSGVTSYMSGIFIFLDLWISSSNCPTHSWAFFPSFLICRAHTLHSIDNSIALSACNPLFLHGLLIIGENKDVVLENLSREGTPTPNLVPLSLCATSLMWSHQDWTIYMPTNQMIFKCFIFYDYGIYWLWLWHILIRSNCYKKGWLFFIGE